VIWRVRWGQDWLYVYLLLEFQSTVDRFMAVRILSYVGLLYQDLIRSGQLTASGQLPPVLPLVLYNDVRRWQAPKRWPNSLRRYRGVWSAIVPVCGIFSWMKGGLPRTTWRHYGILRRLRFGWRTAGHQRMYSGCYGR
jgi:hypothetical protein